MRVKAAWVAGDFTRIARSYEDNAADFVAQPVPLRITTLSFRLIRGIGCTARSVT